MPKLKNVSPFGDLDVPLLRRVVQGGETVDVTDEQAERLLPQDIWEAADTSARKIQKSIDAAALVAELGAEAEIEKEGDTNDAAV